MPIYMPVSANFSCFGFILKLACLKDFLRQFVLQHKL